jgi:isoaspartyl peptidase/L-asparaginase-like protein (Ntn-hydrolase superfamily)
MSETWALILHGGARSIAPEDAAANRQGCLAAAEVGRAILSDGGQALDAVEAVIWTLERDPTFNAGYGAVTNADGVIERDAAIMRGSDLAIGAVGALQDVPHPISVARRLLDETAGLLVGEGARAFAEREGLLAPPFQPTPLAAAGGDTVGCIALDRTGRMAVGLSTGGLDGKMPGRVGDTPLPGCGFYVDDDQGGVALSGDGDAIARVLLAARIMDGLGGLNPQAAIETNLVRLDRVGGEAGAIALDRRGRFGCAHTSDHFAVALASETIPARSVLHQDELQELTPNGE